LNGLADTANNVSVRTSFSMTKYGPGHPRKRSEGGPLQGRGQTTGSATDRTCRRLGLVEQFIDQPLASLFGKTIPVYPAFSAKLTHALVSIVHKSIKFV
jgi:hypothetical protein